MNKHLVSGIMAKLIVDQLEAIDIGIDQDSQACSAPSALDSLEECLPIERTRQLVNSGIPPFEFKRGTCHTQHQDDR